MFVYLRKETKAQEFGATVSFRFAVGVGWIDCVVIS